MEILYRDSQNPLPAFLGADIRWLNEEDYEIFCRHLNLCGQKSFPLEAWRESYAEGVRYCGAFRQGNMVARACVEKYSDTAWEVADVRTVREFRNRGLAGEVCLFVMRYIRDEKRLATIRTEEDNFAMQRVIARLGFEKMA